MIRGHDYAVAGSRRLLENGEGGRALEPGTGQAPESRFVPRDLHEDGGLATPMGHEVYEVEDHGDHGVRRLERGPHAGADLSLLTVRKDLLVVYRNLPTRQTLELSFEELVLEGVQAALVVRLIPPSRVVYRDLIRKLATEDSVPRIRCGRGKDRIMIGLVDLEVPSQKRCDHSPLVEAHTIQNNEEHGRGSQQWCQEFLDNVHGE